jgi:hypothetical protein
LHQLRQDGYSVFIAKGSLPTNTTGKSAHSSVSGDAGRWYTESELLNPGAVTSGAVTNGKPAVVAFSGVGHRLGGDASAGEVNMQDFHVAGDEDDEELQLARAISASMAENAPKALPAGFVSTGDPKKDAAAEMRAKRLAALEKRGL